MDDEVFEKLVSRAVETIPKEFKDLLENVSVVTAPWPSRQQVEELNKRGSGGLLVGLYQGVPKTRRGSYGIGGQLPDKITIFKNPILMIARTPERIMSVVEDTVIHEIAHHFGLSDEDIIRIKDEG